MITQLRSKKSKMYDKQNLATKYKFKRVTKTSKTETLYDL